MTKYLVTGATGNLGSASVENLLKTVPASDISVLARDLEKAKRFSDRGIKVFKGDYFDLQSMIDAFTGIDDLRGKAVVSTSGTTNIRQLNEVNTARKLGINILPAKDHAEAFLMVETDRAAAFVMDDVLLASLVASSKDPAAYAISADALSAAEPYAIMLRRDDAPFKAVVDRATAEVFRGAEGKALYERWFLQPIPPRGLTLNVPMSPALARSYAAPSDAADPAHYGS